MKLWLISQSVNNGYDTYDSAIVAAENAEKARKIDPGNSREWNDERSCWMFKYFDGRREVDKHDAWVCNLENIDVEVVGEAASGVSVGVILASFNAG